MHIKHIQNKREYYIKIRVPKNKSGEIMIDNKRFEAITDRIINSNKSMMGIGTLKEKTVHMVLKNYYESDIDYHEVRINNYVADIYRNGNIIEIQTAGFNKMRAKLDEFLKEYIVTIVYPIPHIKWLNWMDEKSHEIVSRRKSPKIGTPYMAFYELYKIKTYLNNPNLRLKIVMLDMEEYRLLNGWSKDRKRGSVRYDRIPLKIEQEIDIEMIRDFIQLLPYELPEKFTSTDYAKETKLVRGDASTALNILNYIGVIEKVGKKGNSIVYEINPSII